MKTDDFDFHLPDDQIAQRPAPRGTSRLLHLDAAGGMHHRGVGDVPTLLRPGDLLVVNDTRVLPARLVGRRLPGGGRAELLLLNPDPEDPERAWQALLRPAKRLPPGTPLAFAPLDRPESDDRLTATVIARGDGGRGVVRFDQEPTAVLERFGHVPLPPYIRRDDDRLDRQDYQTVFAREPGAVAAPTAGLHFTPELLDALEAAGVARASVTLHVGLGTFRPVTAETAEDHVMDAERYAVSRATADAIRATKRRGGRVVAVGTTVVRTLESAARADERGADDLVAVGEDATRLYIRPGFDFRVVDVLLTNFHLPRSTLLMLVSALAGRERVLDAYRRAVDAGYRFYSYGDAMLLERPEA